jgi:hypothetical protein
MIDDYDDWRKNNLDMLKKEFLKDMDEQFNDFCRFWYERRVIKK